MGINDLKRICPLHNFEYESKLKFKLPVHLMYKNEVSLLSKGVDYVNVRFTRRLNELNRNALHRKEKGHSNVVVQT